MVFLESEKQGITNFIINSIEKFKTEKGKYSAIGVYCCPWVGWISLSFNIEKSIADTSCSCPDFDIVEFELLELSKWEKEYEKAMPTYIYDGRTVKFNHGLGDEILNELFFKFMSTIAIDIKMGIKEELLLQFLDSKFYRVF